MSQDREASGASELMLAQQNPIDLERWVREGPPGWAPVPAADDRPAWEGIAARLGAPRVAELVAQGEAAAREPIPPLPATLWLEFARRGQREGYQRPVSRRREMLTRLAVAECLEAEGRFLDPLLDVVWATLEESSWCLPAHQPELAEMAAPAIDLGAAQTGLAMAELDHLLGGRLLPAVRSRLRYEVDRRLLTPYLTRHDPRWMYSTQGRTVNNWTAVCTAGVAGVACYLEPDPHRLGEILFRAARSLHDYLLTFDRDGGSTEGPGYWSYGFGHYTLLAQLVEARTGGHARWMDAPIVRQAAQFPLRTIMSPGRYVNFSDCDAVVRLIPSHLVYLARRLELPDLEALAARQGRGGRDGELPWALRNLIWLPEAAAGRRTPVPRRDDFFRDMHWMVARAEPDDPDGLVLAAKGGHNGEMHNQNDVGNVIVHLRQESVVADIGRGRYTRSYFGPQRYEHLANSSLGHSVPVVNGCAQASGAAFGATLLQHRADEQATSLALELRGAYPPAAGLASLQRTVTLHRQRPAWVELEDRVRFAAAPGTLESVLTTFGTATEEGQGTVLLQGERGALRVGYDATLLRCRIEVVPQVDLAAGPRDVTRVCFAPAEPLLEATIRLQLIPFP